jgi:hypothetical protein
MALSRQASHKQTLTPEQRAEVRRLKAILRGEYELRRIDEHIREVHDTTIAGWEADLARLLAGDSQEGGLMARRTDANQQPIMDALRAVGCSVCSLHREGHGVPDLLVARVIDGCRVNLLLEVKTREGRLTKDEAEWLAGWIGPVAIVRSVEDALRAVGVEP